MTNLEALKGRASYPLSDNAFTLALTNRSLTAADTYVVANQESLELAYADILCSLVSAPNVSEGGYSVSQSDKQSLIKLATGIYKRYNKASPFIPTAEFKKMW